MKAQKLLTTLLFTSIFITSALSQGFYAKLGGGYAMGMNKQSMLFNYNTINTDDGTTMSQFWYSLGKGITPELEAGYMFNEHFGFGINATYLFGINNTRFNKSVDGENDIYEYFYSRMVLISPYVILQPLNTDFSPYCKLGGTIGLGKYYRKSELNDSKTIQVYSGSIPVGATIAVGFDYSLSESISFYAEINSLIMSWAPEKAELTQFINEGVDELSELTVSQRETVFVESTESYTYKPEEPAVGLKTYYNFNNIGLRVGFKIKF
ncbi:MAG: outer membrane beta-barrel protein [Candidatus Delongbacteria bacterium]|jgi:hypothetical protein|nr:outer membrane beta-barrel protein [Candidatus Delongbacteria bacterium]